MNIEEIKETYATAKEWAERQVADYFYLLKTNKINEQDEALIGEMVLCETWEQVENLIDWRDKVC